MHLAQGHLDEEIAVEGVLNEEERMMAIENAASLKEEITSFKRELTNLKKNFRKLTRRRRLKFLSWRRRSVTAANLLGRDSNPF
jgi:hypothetical protein